MKRVKVPLDIKTSVLTEAGYRCAVPTCRAILAIDLHHMQEVSEGGGNTVENLIALCPTCHALYTRGTISRDSIYAWKSLLVSLNNSFDMEGINNLLFLSKTSPRNDLVISGDGVLGFANLISSGYVDYRMLVNNADMLVTYTINLTEKGQMLLDTWISGDRQKTEELLGLTTHDNVSVRDSVGVKIN